MRRHPFPVVAHFDHCLVLTYAYPEAALTPLLPPGLTLDSYRGFGFLAIALVQTRDLRPAGMPRAMGQDFFLSGYRVFTRFHDTKNRNLRGLRILRSDTDRRRMAFFGNLLTHYHYRPCEADVTAEPGRLLVRIKTPDKEADLDVNATLSPTEAPPTGSPFPDLATARKYAGPLPFTFDYEQQTHSIIVIEGKRSAWDPMPVSVEVNEATFLEGAAFKHHRGVLANAFYMRDIPYRWERGVRHALDR